MSGIDVPAAYVAVTVGFFVFLGVWALGEHWVDTGEWWP